MFQTEKPLFLQNNVLVYGFQQEGTAELTEHGGDRNTNTAEQQTVGSQKVPSIERDVLKLSQYGMVKLKAQTLV